VCFLAVSAGVLRVRLDTKAPKKFSYIHSFIQMINHTLSTCVNGVTENMPLFSNITEQSNKEVKDTDKQVHLNCSTRRRCKETAHAPHLDADSRAASEQTPSSDVSTNTAMTENK